MSAVKNYESVAIMWHNLGARSHSRLEIQEKLHISRSTMWRIIKACKTNTMKDKCIVFAEKLEEELLKVSHN